MWTTVNPPRACDVVRAALLLVTVLFAAQLPAQSLRVTAANSTAPEAVYDVLFSPAGTTLLNADGASFKSLQSLVFVPGSNVRRRPDRRRHHRRRAAALLRAHRHAADLRHGDLEHRLAGARPAATRWPVGGCRGQPLRHHQLLRARSCGCCSLPPRPPAATAPRCCWMIISPARRSTRSSIRSSSPAISPRRYRPRSPPTGCIQAMCWSWWPTRPRPVRLAGRGSRYLTTPLRASRRAWPTPAPRSQPPPSRCARASFRRGRTTTRHCPRAWTSGQSMAA